VDPAPLPYAFALGTLLLAAATYLVILLSALLERSGPIRLRHFAEEGGGRLRALVERPSAFEAFRFVLSLLAKVFPPCLAVALLVLSLRLGLGVGGAAAVAVSALLVGAVIIELVIRTWVGRDPEGALARFTWFYRFALVLLWPALPLLALLMPRVPESVLGDDDDGEASEEEIDAFIAVGEREGILAGEEGEMVRGVVDFGETQVKSVMTPRIDMVCAPVEMNLDELATRFLETRCSRIPLYRDSIDQIVGILHVRELLRGLRAEPRPRAAELAAQPLVVPLTKPLDELLREFQASFQQLAIVVDEYGGVAGLVTLEDLVEEVFGDIADEQAEVEVAPLVVAEGVWVVEGRTHIEELADLTAADLEEGPFETVGGWILHELGEVPVTGASLVAQGLRLTVEEVSDRRIGRVRVERLDGAEETEDGEGR
jgi:putative hemolysin